MLLRTYSISALGTDTIFNYFYLQCLHNAQNSRYSLNNQDVVFQLTVILKPQKKVPRHPCWNLRNISAEGTDINDIGSKKKGVVSQSNPSLWSKMENSLRDINDIEKTKFA